MKLTSSFARAVVCIAGASLVLLTSSTTAAKAILGVDLGSLYMKVALVQRGAPLEIVTNMHSKRKTEQMILFDQGSRFYGADASSLLARKPTKTPVAMSIMLGRDEDHPAVKVLTERHYPLTPDYNETRKGLTLPVDGGKQTFSPEELTAMVLNYAEEITHHYGKEKGNTYGDISDCVLTVPSFATQAERQALLDAAELAGFKVLSLIDENTASAVNFGMDKVYEEPQIYVFYNLGASSLQVSVIKFHSYEVPESKYSKKMKRVGSIEVLGKGWDSTLGGLAFDNQLVEYMADHFNREWRKARKHDKDIRDVPRAMTKIRLQANKVKHVLSANQEIPVHMDSLYDDMSLSMQMSRAQVEELCDDLMDRAVAPVHAALKAANLTLDDVNAIELIGGGMRVPKVQSGLSSVLGDLELGMHINSDESMALGAAFFGANLSTAFRVRHVGLVDINPFPIGVVLEDSEPTKTKGEEEWKKEATIFKENGKVGVKKTIAFTHDKDVHCALDYADTDTLPAGAKPELQRYKLTGVADFAKEMEEKGLGKPKVSLQFELSQSGTCSLIKAEAAVEETYTMEVEVEVEDEDEEGDRSNETNSDADNDEGTERKTEEATEEEDKDANGDNSTADDAAENVTKDEEPPKKKTKMVEKLFGLRKNTKPAFVTATKEMKRTHKKTLEVEKYYVGKVQPLSKELKDEYMFNLAELARKDKERVLLEEAKNHLESYFYKIKNKLVDDEENIATISTAEQREEISKLATEAEDWLFDEGDTAELEVVRAKYEELIAPAEKMWFRLSESTARPAAVKDLKDKLKEVEEKFGKWVAEKEYITEDERADVAAKFEGARKWLADKEEEQAAKASHEDPVFTSEEVPLQMKPIQKLVTKLMKKPAPKVEKNETAEAKAENDTAAESSENATESENDADTTTTDKEEDADAKSEGEEL
ncbi:MAG: hypothetical protein SGILL_001033 [Bacillariaceae sp.]